MPDFCPVSPAPHSPPPPRKSDRALRATHCLRLQPHGPAGPHPIWLALWVALGAALWPGSADAAGQDTVVLVLRVKSDGRYQAAWTRALSDFIAQSGTRLAAHGDLRGEQRRCNDPECMTSVAETLGASVVLGADIDRQGGRERLIHVWLYDVRSGRDQHVKAACDDNDLLERLKSVVGRLVGNIDAAASTPAALGQPPGGPPENAKPTEAAPLGTSPQGVDAARVAPTRSADGANGAAVQPGPRAAGPKRRGRPAWRVALGVSLAVVAGASVGAAIGLSVLHGRPAEGECSAPGALRPDCQNNFTPLFVGGYALSGTSLLGAGLTLLLP